MYHALNKKNMTSDKIMKMKKTEFIFVDLPNVSVHVFRFNYYYMCTRRVHVYNK